MASAKKAGAFLYLYSSKGRKLSKSKHIMRAKSRFKPATVKEVISSGFHGYLHISYAELVDKLGMPNDCTKEGEWKAADEKVRAEWAFKSIHQKNRMVLTIYDYKEYRRPIEDVNQWHVGIKGDAHQVNLFFIEKGIPSEALEIHKKYR